MPSIRTKASFPSQAQKAFGVVYNSGHSNICSVIDTQKVLPVSEYLPLASFHLPLSLI